jgi:hypothetical protein
MLMLRWSYDQMLTQTKFISVLDKCNKSEDARRAEVEKECENDCDDNIKNWWQ